MRMLQEEMERSGDDSTLNNSRADTAISIGLGGLITLAIMSTSAVAFFGSSMEIIRKSCSTA